MATWGSGKPVIALGSDIDGIPQASQKPGVAYHDPIIEGAPGHGEGHNSGRPLNITAAIAVKKIMEREKLPGTIVIWPGVAEELVGTKAYFVRDGLFKDVDVALFTHVGNNLGVSWGDGDGTGLVSVEYTFEGETRARGRRAVARPQRARRRRADEHRLELPPRAPAARAALALRHHQRRRSAERRAADRVASGTTSARSTIRSIKELWEIGDNDGQGRGDDDRHRAAADRACSAPPGRSTSTRPSPRRCTRTSRRSGCRSGARPIRRSRRRCRRSSAASEHGPGDEARRRAAGPGRRDNTRRRLRRHRRHLVERADRDAALSRRTFPACPATTGRTRSRWRRRSRTRASPPARRCRR